MPIKGWDHLEFWVGNAKQAAYYYERAFGFHRIGLRGPGDRRPRPRFLRAAAERHPPRAHDGLRPDSEVCRFAAAHGDGVKDVALSVPERRGGIPQRRAARCESASRSRTGSRIEFGRIELAAIATYGETCTRSSTVTTTPARSCRASRGRARTGSRRAASASRRSTTSSATSSSASMDEWVAVLRARARLHAAGPLRRQGHHAPSTRR